MKFNRETIATISNIGGSGSGLTLLASGTITDPVEFLDITLAAGYELFQLVVTGLLFDTFDYLAGAFSTDGGTTFINDSNSDNYLFNGILVAGSNVAVSGFGFADGGINLSTRQIVDALRPLSLDMTIYPGDTTNYARVHFTTFCFHSTSVRNDLDYIDGWGTVNPGAIIPPLPARINMIRFLPGGNDDVNPPTSGETITAGSWTLLGVPT